MCIASIAYILFALNPHHDKFGNKKMVVLLNLQISITLQRICLVKNLTKQPCLISRVLTISYHQIFNERNTVEFKVQEGSKNLNAKIDFRAEIHISRTTPITIRLTRHKLDFFFFLMPLHHFMKMEI